MKSEILERFHSKLHFYIRLSEHQSTSLLYSVLYGAMRCVDGDVLSDAPASCPTPQAKQLRIIYQTSVRRMNPPSPTSNVRVPA